MKFRRWSVVGLMLVLLLSASTYGFCQGVADLQRNNFPVILMYHDIKETEVNGFDVSVKDFGKQLDWLVAQGYKTLSTDEFLGYLLQDKHFPEKSVFITFDDGYTGIYNYAAPELRKRGMKATFFIFADGIDKQIKDYPYVTKAQVRELSCDPLFSIESHTLTHADLTSISAQQLHQEIENSKKFFENLLKKPCRIIAYPYGHYNSLVLDAVQQAGYEAAFSVSDLGALHHESRYSIPRIYMGVIMGKDDMKKFKYFVVNYQNMPKEAFIERFGPLID